MTHLPPILRLPWGRLAWRLWWAALVAVHVPALWASVRGLAAASADSTDLLGFAALLATTAFFALKLADVPFLRIGSRRRGVLTFVLACSVVHGETMASGLEVGTDHWPVPAAVLAGAVGSAAIASRRRRIARLLERMLTDARPRTELVLARYGRLEQHLLAPLWLASPQPVRIPRAPPG